MTVDQTNDEIKRLEGTYPQRMSDVSGLTERRKLFQFVARSRFDDYMEAFIDEQEKLQSQKNQSPKNVDMLKSH